MYMYIVDVPVAPVRKQTIKRKQI